MAGKNLHLRRRVATILSRVAEAATTPRQAQVPSVAPETLEFPSSESLRKESAESAVPWSVRVAAAISWRVIIIAVVTAALAWAAWQISIIVVPIAIALLLAVLLSPFAAWLNKTLRFPRALAAAVGLLVPLSIVLGALSGAGTQIANQLPRLFSQATEGLGNAADWVRALPINIDHTYLEKIQGTIEQEVTKWLTDNSAQLASGAFSVTSSAATALSGLLLVLFCLFFFLKDGRQIWIWIVRLFPEQARVHVHESALRGWITLSGYVRSQIQVAAIDALGIGLGAYFLDLPMVLPIMVVVFFGSFIPILGALLSGSIAVLVAFVDQGPVAGLIMLAVILVVQQIEGNVLQPLIMSNAVSLHPMAVLLVVAGCGYVAGIPGAIFGVPVAAFLNATFLYLHGYDPLPNLATDPQRPGGAPGTLHDQIVASYRQAGAAPVVLVETPSQSAQDELGEPEVQTDEKSESDNDNE